ncbi:hypothetical protein EVB91_165 [Rhizobium phage RHph_I1_18]|nr:hypothetical protein EVB91_165 [Rhizobium phage RHph_I1_18]
MATYENTPENAKSVGWNNLPEYCIGDPKAKYVTHDTRRGIFIFHD